MNSDTAKVLADTFIQSGYDALDALLGLSFSTDIEAPTEMSAEDVLAIAQEYDVWMRAKVVGGGAVLLAMQMSDVAKIIGLLVGEEDKKNLHIQPLSMTSEVRSDRREASPDADSPLITMDGGRRR